VLIATPNISDELGQFFEVEERARRAKTTI
jgi:hypothetical protein